MSGDHTGFIPAAPPGRGWPRRLWIVAAGALIVLLGGSGLSVYFLTQPPRPRQEAAGEEAIERAKPDLEKFGKEDDAKHFAVECALSRWSNPDRLRPLFNKEARATLDPETGHWTVTWTYSYPGAPARWGVDAYGNPILLPATVPYVHNCKVVVSYTPSDHEWHMVSSE